MASALTTFSLAQTRSARGLLNWALERLAVEAGIECETLELFEAGSADLGERELRRLSEALRGAGVRPIPADLAGEGVRFRGAAGAAITCATTSSSAAEPFPSWLPIDQGGSEPHHARASGLDRSR